MSRPMHETEAKDLVDDAATWDDSCHVPDEWDDWTEADEIAEDLKRQVMSEGW